MAELVFSELCHISTKLTIFGTQLVKMIEICEVHSLSISFNLCQCTTV